MQRQLRHIATATLIVLLAAVAAQGKSPTASASHTIPVTVTITRETAIGDNLEGLGRGEPDLYVGVDINGGGLDAGNSFATHVDNDADVTPFWTITRNVTIADDANPGSIPISIQAWEHDDCSTPFCDDTGVFSSDDDPGDVQPGPGYAATLSLNLSNGRWTGTVNWPQNCVQGDGDTAVRVCFDISIDSASGDADGDFLLDGWERNGFDANGDGTIDVDLPGMGANPLRKDLFLEVDCLVDNTNSTITLRHSHCPAQAAIQTVVQSFANAPNGNVDGTTGIQLHVDTGPLYGVGAVTPIAGSGGATGNLGDLGGGGDQIPEAGNLIVDWDGNTGNPATNFYTLKSANFNANRALIFRYAIFVHQTNARAASNDCTSGWAEGVTAPGNDLLVSLGGTRGGAANPPCWGTDANGNSVGTPNQQAGTLMHEFGHTLALGHGGSDSVNNKPNYLSVMNYTFQSCSVTSAPPNLLGGCDYSRADLNDLNEVAPPGLDECQGLDSGFYGLGPVNWNGDGNFSGPFLDGTSCPSGNPNISFNINGDFNDANGNGTQDSGEAATLSNLTGSDDWASIQFGFRTTGFFGDGGVPQFPDEATPEMIEAVQTLFSDLTAPDLKVDKSGPADAIPGDSLNYSLKVSNPGNGSALAVGLTDTKPDGATTSFSLGTVTIGTSITKNVTFGVACTASDGSILTDSASASGTDLLGATVSATDSFSTTVHAPVLTLSKTATGSVNAGEAITYRLTYANTGSGGANGVTIVDTLPAGVYYSVALDNGAGPTPTSVALNGSGRWVLTWTLGALSGNSGDQVIEFTARPSLLFTGGQTLVNESSLTFTNGNGCTYSPVTATANTSISVVTPSKDPRGLGYFRNTPSAIDEEALARIQATDQRFDGADGSSPDGVLSRAEFDFVLVPGGNMDKVLEEQLLTTYANLATRRFNAATGIDARLAGQLGIGNVASAAIYATNTLALPVTNANRSRYSDATTVLDGINNGKNLVY